MEKQEVVKLKNEYAKFITLFNELNRAKNNKERERIEYDISLIKTTIIDKFELRKYDPQIFLATQFNNDYFKHDIKSLIDRFELLDEKISLLLKEISHKGKLNEFENTIEKIIRTIINSQCEISCSDIHEVSSFEQSKLYSFNPIIRIGFKGEKEKPIHYIWDILHEFGHFLSGVPKFGEEKTIARETLAWDLGLEELKKYPELIIHIEDYNIYREHCLLTYK
jgi:hypothetical protein